MRRAFSLIELMVVIAIVAILSAVAVPAYKSYVLKAKVLESVRMLQFLADEALEEYERVGQFPSTILVNGVSVGSTWTTVQSSANDIYNAIYQTDNSSYAHIGITISGLSGIPGYVEPDVNLLQYSKIYYGITNVNGIMQVTCGQGNLTFPTRFVPLEYLPSACQCNDVQGGTCL